MSTHRVHLRGALADAAPLYDDLLHAHAAGDDVRDEAVELAGVLGSYMLIAERACPDDPLMPRLRLMLASTSALAAGEPGLEDLLLPAEGLLSADK